MQIEPDGTESLFGSLDSIYIAGDSIINGITYTLIRGTSLLEGNSSETGLLNIVRESEGEIINIDDRIILSTTNFTDILQIDTIPQSEDPIFIIENRMQSVEETVSVPAGIYDDAINYEGKVFVRPTTIMDSIRFRDNIYAEGVGRVLFTSFFSSSNNMIESRLVRFNVQ